MSSHSGDKELPRRSMIAHDFCAHCNIMLLSSEWVCWVAVKELNLSYYIGATLLFTVYTHYGNFI